MTSLVLSSFANPVFLAQLALAMGSIVLAWFAWRQQHLVGRALCLGAAVALALAIMAQSERAVPTSPASLRGVTTLAPLLGWPVAHALLTR